MGTGKEKQAKSYLGPSKGPDSDVEDDDADEVEEFAEDQYYEDLVSSWHCVQVRSINERIS